MAICTSVTNLCICFYTRKFWNRSPRYRHADYASILIAKSIKHNASIIGAILATLRIRDAETQLTSQGLYMEGHFPRLSGKITFPGRSPSLNIREDHLPRIPRQSFWDYPKKYQPGKWHLITDLSFPEVSSTHQCDFGAMLKSIIGIFKSIIGSGLQRCLVTAMMSML